MNQPNIKAALIAAGGVIVAAIITYFGAIRPTQMIISATQTAEARVASATSPNPTPTTASTPVPTAPFNPARSSVYDAFEWACLRKSLWGIFVVNKGTADFMPTPAAECWTMEASFSVSEQDLRFHPTTAGSQGASFLAANVFPEPILTYTEITVMVKRASGTTSGIGLFTRVDDASRSWVYYYLEFGSQLESDKSRVVFSDPEGQKTYGNTVLTYPYEATLGIWWDGVAMHFYLNGVESLPSVPYTGNADTMGIYWITGANSSLDASIREVRVIFP